MAGYSSVESKLFLLKKNRYRQLQYKLLNKFVKLVGLKKLRLELNKKLRTKLNKKLKLKRKLKLKK